MAELAAIVMLKASVVAVVVLAVLHTGLSEFDKALIIALASGTVTGLFTLAAALVAARLTRPIRQQVDEIHEKTLETTDQQGE